MSSAESTDGGGPLEIGDFDPGPPAPKIYNLGVLQQAPIIAYSTFQFTSSGAIGPYFFSFGITFSVPPTVVFSVNTEAEGMSAHILGGVTTTGFFAYVSNLVGGGFAAGSVILIDWIAMGR